MREAGRGALQTDVAVAASCGELEAGEGLDGVGAGGERRDVADDDLSVAAGDDGLEAVAQMLHVPVFDRAGDDENASGALGPFG